MQQFHIPGRYLDHSNEFFSFYDVERIITCSAVKLKEKERRKCRFCGKDSSSTSFEKVAHLLPEMLGNHTLVSDFECDMCNSMFGLEYENHLSHFLGISKTLCGIQGKSKVPSFMSPRNKLVANYSTSDNPYGTVAFTRSEISDTTFSIDKETGQTTISYKSNSYIPIRVYKSFLKMALSCLPQRYVKDYTLAFQYLTSNEMDEHLKLYNKVGHYTFSPAYAIESPIAVLFKKRVNNSSLFTHIFLLCYGNSIFQLIVPLQIEDAHRLINKSVRAYFSPPLFFQELVDINKIEIVENLWSFDSPELCKDGWGKMEFSVEKLDNAEAEVAYDKIKTIEIIREPIEPSET